MLYNQNNLAVAKFASKSDTRPELAGVLFTPKKTVATDEFRLLEVSVDTAHSPEDFPYISSDPLTLILDTAPDFIVPAKSLTMKLPKKTKLPVLQYFALKSVNNETAEFVTTNLETVQTTTARITQGNYPEYQKIIPTTEPIATVKINGKRLGELLIAIANMTPKGYIDINFHGENQPVTVTGGTDTQKALGLCMPVRS